MCGIVGYIGANGAVKEVLLNGLSKLEYRGYDSAGLVCVENNRVFYERSLGRVSNLESAVVKSKVLKLIDNKASFGIAHTRWATHGKPSKENAHPHKAGDIYLVHNGIVENYKELKEALLTVDGSIEFTSQTDSEVLVHLISSKLDSNPRRSMVEAVQSSLNLVKGTYAIVVLNIVSGEMVCACNGSPLVLGIADDEGLLVASDTVALIGYAKHYLRLADGDVVSLSPKEYVFVSGTDKEVLELEESGQTSSLGGVFGHYMLKEIYEQGEVVDRVVNNKGQIYDILPKILKAKRLIIVGCGTSYNVGLVAEYLIERLSQISVEVEVASEFRYRDMPMSEGDVAIVLSQSGETVDTLEAVKLCKERGVLTVGIVNVEGSAIANACDAVIYNKAGREVSVASTKAFTSQLAVLSMLAIMLGECRSSLTTIEATNLMSELSNLPAVLSQELDRMSKQMEDLAKKYGSIENIICLGRGVQSAIALEGALKIKEVSYINAQAYPSGEIKHGPLALVDPNTLCIILAPKDELYTKSLSVIEEVKARGGIVIAITTPNGKEVIQSSDGVVIVPSVMDELLPFMTILPMQFFAYHLALLRGCDVDKPRNLAKSVTVE